MNRIAAIAFGAVIALAGTAWAQHPQPYAGLQTRSIKSLSDQQIADLEAGRGMGLALAAELNGYPGPSHVLELATELGLTEAQRARVAAQFAAMKAETIPIGARLLEEEADLNRQFASRTITPATLDAATAAIGKTQAALRAAHLKYHLATADLLTDDQTARYAVLRGYAGGGQPLHEHMRHTAPD
jgi:hypothetical protein